MTDGRKRRWIFIVAAFLSSAVVTVAVLLQLFSFADADKIASVSSILAALVGLVVAFISATAGRRSKEREKNAPLARIEKVVSEEPDGKHLVYYTPAIVWRRETDDERSGNLHLLTAAQVEILNAMPKGVKLSIQQIASLAIVTLDESETALRSLIEEGIVKSEVEEKTGERLFAKKYRIELPGEES
ncbi:hypothetical protein ACWEF6_05500 [Amycolatopsis sp. NPDC004772]